MITSSFRILACVLLALVFPTSKVCAQNAEMQGFLNTLNCAYQELLAGGQWPTQGGIPIPLQSTLLPSAPGCGMTTFPPANGSSTPIIHIFPAQIRGLYGPGALQNKDLIKQILEHEIMHVNMHYAGTAATDDTHYPCEEAKVKTQEQAMLCSKISALCSFLPNGAVALLISQLCTYYADDNQWLERSAFGLSLLCGTVYSPTEACSCCPPI